MHCKLGHGASQADRTTNEAGICPNHNLNAASAQASHNAAKRHSGRIHDPGRIVNDGRADKTKNQGSLCLFFVSGFNTTAFLRTASQVHR